MFGKQLNFLKIFDEAKQNKDQTEKVEDKVEDVEPNEKPKEAQQESKLEMNPEEPVLEVNSEEPEDEPKPIRGTFIKLIPGIKLPESELEILRAKLLEKDANLSPEDFRPFAEEINKYNERYEEIGEIFRQSAPSTEKMRLYEKKVFPDILEEEKYLAAAKLYMKYIKACDDKLKLEEAQKNAKKAKKGKAIKDLEKAQASQNEKLPESDEKPENNESAPDQSEEEPDSDDNKPDPYGDIYPYGRRFKKRK